MEKNVRPVISPAKCEEKRMEDSICQDRGDDMLDICLTYPARCVGVRQKGRYALWNACQNVVGRSYGEVLEVFFGQLHNMSA